MDNDDDDDDDSGEWIKHANGIHKTITHLHTFSSSILNHHQQLDFPISNESFCYFWPRNSILQISLICIDKHRNGSTESNELATRNENDMQIGYLQKRQQKTSGSMSNRKRGTKREKRNIQLTMRRWNQIKSGPLFRKCKMHWLTCVYVWFVHKPSLLRLFGYCIIFVADDGRFCSLLYLYTNIYEYEYNNE